MSRYCRTILIRNDGDKPLDLYVEFFVPQLFELLPRRVFKVFLISTDPQLSNVSLDGTTFSVWIEGAGLGIELPGKADLVEEFYVVDLSTGNRLSER